ncbi:MAG TPA: hypothetical protein VFK16_10725 [Gemmatimonadaceae bacterium]|nr:hypothetical protein [Gemmatimonadaceae bacterium]
MRVKISGIGVVLLAVLQMACGNKAAPPPPTDTNSAPPPDMGKAAPPPGPFRVVTQKEYDSIEAARKKSVKADSARKAVSDSSKR